MSDSSSSCVLQLRLISAQTHPCMSEGSLVSLAPPSVWLRGKRHQTGRCVCVCVCVVLCVKRREGEGEGGGYSVI